VTILASDLIADAQAKSDLEASEFVDSARWLIWCDQAVKELHRVVSATFAATYFRTTDFTLTGTTYTYSLPATFMRLKGLDVYPDTPMRRSVRRFNFAERNRSADYGSNFGGTWQQFDRLRYNVVGSNILELQPQEHCAYPYRLYWVPRPTAMVATSTPLDVELEPYWEYVSAKMAIFAATKGEDWDVVNTLNGQLKTMRADMLEAVETDEGAPCSIIDERGDGSEWGG
jgi:hypothetical protein